MSTSPRWHKKADVDLQEGICHSTSWSFALTTLDITRIVVFIMSLSRLWIMIAALALAVNSYRFLRADQLQPSRRVKIQEYRPDGGETICHRRWPFRFFSVIRWCQWTRQVTGSLWLPIYVHTISRVFVRILTTLSFSTTLTAAGFDFRRGVSRW